MPEQDRTTIKEWFETGDRPTELQFVDFIDSVGLVGENVFLVWKGLGNSGTIEDFLTLILQAANSSGNTVSFLNNGAAPANTFGSDGDYVIEKDSGTLYEKDSGVWTDTGINITRKIANAVGGDTDLETDDTEIVGRVSGENMLSIQDGQFRIGKTGSNQESILVGSGSFVNNAVDFYQVKIYSSDSLSNRTVFQVSYLGGGALEPTWRLGASDNFVENDQVNSRLAYTAAVKHEFFIDNTSSSAMELTTDGNDKEVFRLGRISNDYNCIETTSSDEMKVNAYGSFRLAIRGALTTDHISDALVITQIFNGINNPLFTTLKGILSLPDMDSLSDFNTANNFVTNIGGGLYMRSIVPTDTVANSLVQLDYVAGRTMGTFSSPLGGANATLSIDTGNAVNGGRMSIIMNSSSNVTLSLDLPAGKTLTEHGGDGFALNTTQEVTIWKRTDNEYYYRFETI